MERRASPPGLTGETPVAPSYDLSRITRLDAVVSNNQRSTLGAIQNLRMPRHLDCFQLGFVRLGGIVFEVGERDHVFVEVGETNRERVDFGMDFREQNPDVFRIAPGKFFRHEWSPTAGFKVSRFQSFKDSAR